MQDIGEEQAQARKGRQDRQGPGKAEANVKMRQARQRKVEARRRRSKEGGGGGRGEVEERQERRRQVGGDAVDELTEGWDAGLVAGRRSCSVTQVLSCGESATRGWLGCGVHGARVEIKRV